MIVYVPVLKLILLKISLTRPVLTKLVGCCAAIPVVKTVDQVTPSKLYGKAASPIPVSETAEIVIVPTTHSYPELLVKVNVGAVISKRYVLAVPVPIFPAVSCTLKLIVIPVV